MPLLVSNGLNLANQRITSLADPSAANDAATKQYVDNAIAGLSFKDSVRVATTTNGTLSTAFANGQTVDGVVLATGNRILIKNQTTASENGIYVVAASGAPARAADAATGAALLQATVLVEEGTVGADTLWTCTTNGPITLGSTSLSFVQFSVGTSYTAGAGLTLTSNAFSVDTNIVARKFTAAVGDGTTTALTVTHNLGTKDVHVSVRDSATDAFVLADMTAATTNTVTVTFATAPAAGAYRVTVIG